MRLMEKTPAFHVQPFGSYYLLERIAVGGMAEIFKAKQIGVRGFEKILVIKKILQHLSEDPEFVEMFEDEAKIAAQLNQANIVQIYELGETEGTLYITMEYVDGKNMRDITRAASGKSIHLAVDQCVMMMSEILKGLDYAHRKCDSAGHPLSIVHRDMSPQNVIVSYDGEIKILDFGIAKAASKASRTEAGVLKGKFSYMSPEQAAGKIITQVSDVYACGVMLHELLTSERLFRAKTDMETLNRVKEGHVEPPSQKNPNVPPELDAIVMKALQKDIELRYASASEMLVDLTHFSFEQKYSYSTADLSIFMKTLFAETIEEEKARLLDALGRIPPSPLQLLKNAKTHIAFKRTPTATGSQKSDAKTEADHRTKDEQTLTVEKKARSLFSFVSKEHLAFAALILGGLFFLTVLFSPRKSSEPPAETSHEQSENIGIPMPEIPDQVRPEKKEEHHVDIIKNIEPPKPQRPSTPSSETVGPKNVPQSPAPEPKPSGYGFINVAAPPEGFAQLSINGRPHGTVPGPTARNIRLSEGTHTIRCETGSRTYSGRIRIQANQTLQVHCQNLK